MCNSELLFHSRNRQQIILQREGCPLDQYKGEAVYEIKEGKEKQIDYNYVDFG